MYIQTDNSHLPFPSCSGEGSYQIQLAEQIHALEAEAGPLASSSSATASLAKWLRRPPRERKVPGSNPTCDGIFSGSSHTSDFKIGTPVATLPGAWRYRVSTGTGLPGVSIL